MIIGIEIIGNAAILLKFTGKYPDLKIERPKEKFEIPEANEGMEKFLDFQKNLEMYFRDNSPEKIILCEGGAESKKTRVRLEFSALVSAHQIGISYETYVTSAATKYINSGFKHDHKVEFNKFFENFKLPQSYKRIIASIIKKS